MPRTGIVDMSDNSDPYTMSKNAALLGSTAPTYAAIQASLIELLGRPQPGAGDHRAGFRPPATARRLSKPSRLLWMPTTGCWATAAILTPAACDSRANGSELEQYEPSGFTQCERQRASCQRPMTLGCCRHSNASDKALYLACVPVTGIRHLAALPQHRRALLGELSPMSCV